MTPASPSRERSRPSTRPDRSPPTTREARVYIRRRPAASPNTETGHAIPYGYVLPFRTLIGVDLPRGKRATRDGAVSPLADS
jgi:hypothetical protein